MQKILSAGKEFKNIILTAGLLEFPLLCLDFLCAHVEMEGNFFLDPLPPTHRIQRQSNISPVFHSQYFKVIQLKLLKHFIISQITLLCED